jgi:hypothetical protein
MRCPRMKKKNLCKKNDSKSNTSTKLFLVLVFFCLCLLPYPSKSRSYSIEPAIEEFVLELDQEITSSVSFTNTSEQKQDFKVYNHRYNPKEQKILDDRDFITLETNSLSLEPDETGEIQYKINIPINVVPGSFFSIIVVEDVNQEDIEQTGGIGLNYGIGSLIAIHVIDDTNISDVFLNQTDTKLEYKKPLSPLNTVIEYSIKNNSKYVFLPTGQLTISSKKDKPIFYKINQEETRLYPGQSLSFEFEYQGTLKDLITNKMAVTKIGSQYSNDLKEDQIKIPYFTQTTRIVAAVLIFLVVLTTSIVLVKKSNENTLKEAFKEKIAKKD